MRKLCIILVSALLIGTLVSTARAEQSTSTFTGDRYEEQQVWVYAFNNSGAIIQSNAVVTLDTTATAGTQLGTYITTSVTADDYRVFGVTGENIGIASVGKVCVRGPKEVLDSDKTHALAAILACSTSRGETTTYSTSDGTTGGYLGHVIGATSSLGEDYVWVWINPQIHD